MILGILICVLIVLIALKLEKQMLQELSDGYKEDSNIYFNKMLQVNTELKKANLKISRLQGQIEELKGNK